MSGGLARERIAPLLRDGDRCALATGVAGALLFVGTLAGDALHPPPNRCATIVGSALMMELVLLAAIGVTLGLLRAATMYLDWRPAALAYVAASMLTLIPLAALDTLLVANLIAGGPG